MHKIYDFAVVGSGSVGSAAGYYAARSGLDVLELDLSTPPHEEGSHHGQTRIIRHAYGEGSNYVPLVLQAQRLWEELAQTSARDIFRQTGVLNVGHKDNAFIKNAAHSAQEYGLSVEKLTAEQIKKRWPNWNFTEDYQGLFEKKSGYLLSENAIKAYLELAAAAGADQDFTAQVLKIKQIKNDLVEIKTKTKTYYAHQVAVTAGTWVKELLPKLPIVSVRKVFTWYDIATPSLNESAGFPCFAVETKEQQAYYGFPGENGTIKIGRHDGGQPIQERSDRTPYGSYPNDQLELQPLVTDYLSGIAGINHGAACTYDLSPDENFIIDRAPGQPNIQIVTGLSGHGFKFASVLGKILAQRAQHQEDELPLNEFKLERF